MGKEARRRQLGALVDELSGGGALAMLRLSLLRTLDQFGPQTVTEIPRAWPLTREHIRRAIRSLADDGLLELRIDSARSRSGPATERRQGSVAMTRLLPRLTSAARQRPESLPPGTARPRRPSRSGPRKTPRSIRSPRGSWETSRRLSYRRIPGAIVGTRPPGP